MVVVKVTAVVAVVSWVAEKVVVVVAVVMVLGDAELYSNSSVIYK